MKKEDLIKRLQENKKKCKKFNFFGENCHKELDIRIKILEDDISPQEAENIYGFDYVDIFDVLYGELDIDDILYPEVL